MVDPGGGILHTIGCILHLGHKRCPFGDISPPPPFFFGFTTKLADVRKKANKMDVFSPQVSSTKKTKIFSVVFGCTNDLRKKQKMMHETDHFK